MSEPSLQQNRVTSLNSKIREEGFWSRFTRLFRKRNGDQNLRDTIEEILESADESEEEAATPIGAHERTMFSNILQLRHLTAYDVMVPRADINGIELDSDYETLLKVFKEAGHSRLPVFRETLDDLAGMVHVKDIIDQGRHGAFKLGNFLRPLEVVSPSIRALDLLLEMRLKRFHMVLVVDEFGGIDGLVTIEDLVEQIVGEIEDEHDVEEGPKLIWRKDGTLLADARATIEEFETEVGQVLSNEERDEDIDTLGGLVFFLADRIPTRGELIRHPHSGIVFEVVQADPRRIKRLKMRKLATRAARAKPEQGAS